MVHLICAVFARTSRLLITFCPMTGMTQQLALIQLCEQCNPRQLDRSGLRSPLLLLRAPPGRTIRYLIPRPAPAPGTGAARPGLLGARRRRLWARRDSRPHVHRLLRPARLHSATRPPEILAPQGKRHLRKRRPYNALAGSEALAFVLSLRNRDDSIIQLFLLMTTTCVRRQGLEPRTSALRVRLSTS